MFIQIHAWLVWRWMHCSLHKLILWRLLLGKSWAKVPRNWAESNALNHKNGNSLCKMLYEAYDPSYPLDIRPFNYMWSMITWKVLLWWSFEWVAKGQYLFKCYITPHCAHQSADRCSEWYAVMFRWHWECISWSVHQREGWYFSWRMFYNFLVMCCLFPRVCINW